MTRLDSAPKDAELEAPGPGVSMNHSRDGLMMFDVSDWVYALQNTVQHLNHLTTHEIYAGIYLKSQEDIKSLYVSSSQLSVDHRQITHTMQCVAGICRDMQSFFINLPAVCGRLCAALIVAFPVGGSSEAVQMMWWHMVAHQNGSNAR